MFLRKLNSLFLALTFYNHFSDINYIICSACAAGSILLWQAKLEIAVLNFIRIRPLGPFFCNIFLDMILVNKTILNSFRKLPLRYWTFWVFWWLTKQLTLIQVNKVHFYFHWNTAPGYDIGKLFKWKKSFDWGNTI